MIDPSRRQILVLSAAAVAAYACGGAAKSPSNAGVDVDGDPFSLLPSSSVGLASLDARAFYASNTVGAQMAVLSEKLVPLGEESGFSASRDVDKVVLAFYATGSVDAAGVISGRFDPDKIATSAANNTITKMGAPLAVTQYTGRTLYTVANVGFCVLSEKTVVAGTSWGIRRTLEKLQSGKLVRAFPPWMIDTALTSGASVAAAVDLEDSQVAAAALGAVQVQGLAGMRLARIVGNFGSPGMHLALRLSYGDPGAATTGAAALKTLNAIGSVFLKLQDVDVETSGADVTATVTVDDSTLGWMLGLAQNLVPTTATPAAQPASGT